MSTFVELIGRLHPLLVHFPIALILVAAALEIARLRERWSALDGTLLLLLWLGGLTALLSIGSGFIFQNDFAPAPSERWMLPWHRRLCIASAVLTLLAALITQRATRPIPAGLLALRRALVWLAALLVMGGAHYGALMVWGHDYFTL